MDCKRCGGAESWHGEFTRNTLDLGGFQGLDLPALKERIHRLATILTSNEEQYTINANQDYNEFIRRGGRRHYCAIEQAFEEVGVESPIPTATHYTAPNS